MRDARVAPVEDPVTAVFHEDLAVVEIVVLDRVGHDPEVFGPRPNLRYQIREHLLVCFRHSFLEADP